MYILEREINFYTSKMNKSSFHPNLCVIMSLSILLFLVYTAFLNNQVPAIWADAAYPSLKSLASWIKDLLLRCDFMAVIITS